MSQANYINDKDGWWYVIHQPELDTIPVYGPFKLQALAAKDYYFYAILRQYPFPRNAARRYMVAP
jgi:hypothetical protein